MSENVDLNKLVKELYDKIGSKKEFKIITIETDTIYFIDNYVLKISIKIAPMNHNDSDEILKQAEMIKKWRDKPLFKEGEKK